MAASFAACCPADKHCLFERKVIAKIDSIRILEISACSLQNCTVQAVPSEDQKRIALPACRIRCILQVSNPVTVEF